ncbi:MAG: CPBP family intramembrane glutamic endopeptidase, partial [bacterium]
LNKLVFPISGVLLAIFITTTMDATGYAVFSALPLIPLAGLGWYLEKHSRQSIGLIWGPTYGYFIAILYPALVLGSITLITLALGATDTTDTDWEKTTINIALMSSTGIIMVLITEEGFFRGWLWASLGKAGLSERWVLVVSSLLFTIWHLSAVSLDTGFDLPLQEIPIYLVNATLLGLIFGMTRMLSGSVVVAAVCHAIWNGFDYPLFGFGKKIGSLGIDQIQIYGPEVGLLGIVFNGFFAAALWYWMVQRSH